MEFRKLSISRNFSANLAAQIYVSIIGVVMAPVYLSRMGQESYGLIGFFTMLTAWFQLLDVGLTPTLVRETARFRGGAISLNTLRSFLRGLEIIFGSVALVGAIAFALFSNEIASNWLQVKVLPINEVKNSVLLMGMTVPLRWLSSLYRGAIVGFERQVLLSSYNVLMATFRFIGVLSVFAFLGTSPTYFFGYQFGIALVDLAGVGVITYALIGTNRGNRYKFSWKPLASNLTFSLTIAFAAIVWVLVTQTDKLVLSRLLPLAAFGTFSLAVAAAGVVLAASVPFVQAMLPRLTKLAAENDETGLARLYGDATQAVCVLIAPAVATLSFFAEPILRGWTGKADIAHHAAPILSLYAIGNGFSAIGAFAYYMQYARGDLFLHFFGSAILFVIIVPGFIAGADYYGGIGTGFVWAAVNVLYVLAWVPVVHARVFPGRHWTWLTRDIVPILFAVSISGWFISEVAVWPTGRWPTLAFGAALGFCLLIVAAASSSMARSRAIEWAAPWIARLSKANT